MSNPEDRIPSLKIAVAIPCFNEEASIGGLVRSFHHALPEVPVHVFDNRSTDRSSEKARSAGALIHSVSRQGKGFVIRAILEEIRADAVLIVDGDGTYLAEDAVRLLQPLIENKADMIVGTRLQSADKKAFQFIRQAGNIFITQAINAVFGCSFQDILSGYRVIGRKMAEQIRIESEGFEVETELTIKAVISGLNIFEIPVHYKPRTVRDGSKLRPFRDGLRIVFLAAVFLKKYRPFRFFSILLIIIGLLILSIISAPVS